MGNLKTAYPYSGFITATAPVPTSFYPQMQWEMLWLKAMRERVYFFYQATVRLWEGSGRISSRNRGGDHEEMLLVS